MACVPDWVAKAEDMAAVHEQLHPAEWLSLHQQNDSDFALFL
jgi:hypothetical protein